jgi:hypothetical protein
MDRDTNHCSYKGLGNLLAMSEVQTEKLSLEKQLLEDKLECIEHRLFVLKQLRSVVITVYAIILFLIGCVVGLVLSLLIFG